VPVEYTYLFFEFGDGVAGEIVLCVVVLVIFVLLFVDAEGERIDGFVVSVESVDEVLVPDSVAFGVVVEVADAGDMRSYQPSRMSLVAREPVVTEVLWPLQGWGRAVCPNLGFVRTLNLAGALLHGLLDCFILNVFR